LKFHSVHIHLNILNNGFDTVFSKRHSYLRRKLQMKMCHLNVEHQCIVNC